MSTLDIQAIGRDLLITAMWLAGPSVLVSLLVGIIISLAQTVTSLQEQTLSFAPRIIAVGAVLLLTLPWMLQTCSAFTLRMAGSMLEFSR